MRHAQPGRRGKTLPVHAERLPASARPWLPWPVIVSPSRTSFSHTSGKLTGIARAAESASGCRRDSMPGARAVGTRLHDSWKLADPTVVLVAGLVVAEREQERVLRPCRRGSCRSISARLRVDVRPSVSETMRTLSSQSPDTRAWAKWNSSRVPQMSSPPATISRLANANRSSVRRRRGDPTSMPVSGECIHRCITRSVFHQNAAQAAARLLSNEMDPASRGGRPTQPRASPTIHAVRGILLSCLLAASAFPEDGPLGVFTSSGDVIVFFFFFFFFFFYCATDLGQGGSV